MCGMIPGIVFLTSFLPQHFQSYYVRDVDTAKSALDSRLNSWEYGYPVDFS
jgi:hypothetical protein